MSFFERILPILADKPVIQYASLTIFLDGQKEIRFITTKQKDIK